jgi:hypothetical protein
MGEQREMFTGWSEETDSSNQTSLMDWVHLWMVLLAESGGVMSAVALVVSPRKV